MNCERQPIPEEEIDKIGEEKFSSDRKLLLERATYDDNERLILKEEQVQKAKKEIEKELAEQDKQTIEKLTENEKKAFELLLQYYSDLSDEIISEKNLNVLYKDQFWKASTKIGGSRYKIINQLAKRQFERNSLNKQTKNSTESLI